MRPKTWESGLGLEDDVEVVDRDNLEPAKLILWNDDVTPFEWVVKAVKEILHYDEEQAVNCVMIAHNKGSYIIKKGDEKELQPLKDEFLEYGE